MDREPYFKELCIALAREGFTLQSEQDGLLPVNWNNLPLCRVTDAGGIRYWQENVAAPDREQALGRATHLAGMVREYMTLLEQAPPLQAQSLTGNYYLLADFNGTVLAAHPTRLGIHFVTWDWNFDHTALNQGKYFQADYEDTKQNFAIRSGLIPEQKIFDQEQLIEIYQCCSDTLDAGLDLTYEQEQRIKSVQEQILNGTPNVQEHITEQGQHTIAPQSQELTMEVSFNADEVFGTNVCTAENVCGIWAAFRGSGKPTKVKQEKEPGTSRPRLSHFCPQCGQFQAFCAGDNGESGNSCWTL